MSEQALMDRLNKIVNELLGGVERGRHRNRLVYWNPPKGWQGTVYLFGYTPWETFDREHNKKGYFALKYRRLRGGRLKLVKSVRFGKRKTAKKRSLEWHKKHYRP